MKPNRLSIFCYLIFFFLITSCTTNQSRIDSVAAKIEIAESDLQELSDEDWKELVEEMKELRNDYVENKESYSSEQRKEIGRLKGRFTALQLKKGVNDIKNSVLDFGSEIEGLIESFK